MKKAAIEIGAYVFIVIALVVAGRMVAGNSSPQVIQPTIKGGEQLLRHQAISKPRPDYPVDDLSRKVTGLCVVNLEIGVTGNVEKTYIIQAPSISVASAVEIAVRRWTFLPVMYEGKAVRLEGKLYFYFQIVDGQGLVLFPDEVSTDESQLRR